MALKIFANFGIAEDFDELGLFDVEDLSPERQNRLRAGIPSGVRASAGGVPFDQVEFADGQVVVSAIAELFRQAPGGRGFFRPHHFPRFLGGFAGLGSAFAFLADAFGNRGVLFKELGKPLGHDRRHDAFHVRVGQLDLGLAFKQRIGNPHRDHRGQAFAEILTRGRHILKEIVLFRVVVDRPRDRSAKTGKMRAAFAVVDVVRKGPHVFREAVVMLERHVHEDHAILAVALAFEIDYVGIIRRGSAVEVFDEFDQAVLIMKLIRLSGPLIFDANPHARRQEGQLLEPSVQNVIAEFRIGENHGVRLEGQFGALLIGAAQLLERVGQNALGKRHRPDMPIPADLGFEPFANRVDGGNPHAMQPAGAGFVAAFTTKFSAGVDFRQHNFQCRPTALIGHRTDWNPTAVIRHRDAAVNVNRALDIFTELIDRFINAVIHAFKHQVMQPMRAGIADVHRRPGANPFDPLQGLDLLGVIIVNRLVLRHRRQFVGADVLRINRFVFRCLGQLVLLP